MPKMIASESGRTIARRAVARSKFSNCPPHSWERDVAGDGRPRLLDEAHEVASADVHLDAEASLHALPAHLRGAIDVAHGRDLSERHELPLEGPDRQASKALRTPLRGRQQHPEVEAPSALVDLTDATPLPRGLDRGQHVLRIHAVAREPTPIRLHLQHGQTERALDAHVSGAGDAAEGAADAPPEVGHLLQIFAEEEDRDVRPRAGDELVRAVLDGLGDRDEGRGHLALDRGLHHLSERVEVVGGRPRLAGL
jgi:hypothetical protein